jgi:hydrogenase-4 component B
MEIMMDQLAQGVSLSANLVLVATLLAGCSGIPGLFLGSRPGRGQIVAAWFLVAAGVLGVTGAVMHLFRERSESFILSWTLPFGTAELFIDPLSAIFLIPIFLVGACSGLYAVGYWPASRQRGSEARLSFFLGTLVASMSLVVMACNGALFLIVWEFMALSSFFAMTVSDRDRQVRDAGLVYLVATHCGTLLLFVMFAHLKVVTGGFSLPAVGSLDPNSGYATLIFLAALIGFGAKAGLMPFHVWLPAAHASAPSHISAMMSGVMLKMGIYGIVRVLSFFSVPPIWWGVLVLVLGVISGVVGVMFALGQHDIKRLLAYHSIENIGIIAIGIGLALIGRTMGSSDLALLGMSGALLHTVNHATFKSLLFLGAGSVIHATETREIDLMGGLSRRLPWTSLCFLVGSVAICGLPPLNGFVSEFLVYLAAFSGLIASESWLAAIPAVAAPALALIGALAVACFVKVFGIAFLGLPRSISKEDEHEGGWQMLTPMVLLAAICIFIGVFPFLISPLVQSAAFAWLPSLAASSSRLPSLAPLVSIAAVNGLLLALLLVFSYVILKRVGSLGVSPGVTWDCGYIEPTPRMQYTSSSFAEMLTRLNAMFLRPEWHSSKIKGLFPAAAKFSSHVPEVVLEQFYLPLLAKIQSLIAPLRRVQHGQLHLYVLYILVTLVSLLFWSHW